MESLIIPRVLTKTNVIRTPRSKCGDNWHLTVRVRSASGNTDLVHADLPSLGDPSLVSSFDLMFIDEVRGDIERISNLVGSIRSILSPRQMATISEMIQRAKCYVGDAQKIAKLWNIGFATMRFGTVPAWPLGGQPKGRVNASIEEGHSRDEMKYKRLMNSALQNLRCAEEFDQKVHLKEKNRSGKFRPQKLGDLIERISKSQLRDSSIEEGEIIL